MATHSSILAWRSPWTEEPDRLKFTGSQRVTHDWATEHTSIHTYTHVCTHSFIGICGFPGGSDRKVSACNAGDTGSVPGSERSPGEGNGNPLQYSCLENPMDRGAWRSSVHGVTKSQTQLSDFTFTFTLYTHIKLNLWAVHLKLTLHCKSTALQSKNKADAHFNVKSHHTEGTPHRVDLGSWPVKVPEGTGTWAISWNVVYSHNHLEKGKSMKGRCTHFIGPRVFTKDLWSMPKLICVMPKIICVMIHLFSIFPFYFPIIDPQL